MEETAAAVTRYLMVLPSSHFNKIMPIAHLPALFQRIPRTVLEHQQDSAGILSYEILCSSDSSKFMNESISNFLYGALGGGLVATGMRIAETYWIAPRFTESLEARKKLFMYASPLSHACHELKYRLNSILQNIHVSDGTKASLSLSPKGIQTIDWFTKSGYYLTSTAYLICLTSAWIQLYERDVVFLKFGRTSLTRRFFALIEKFKNDLSSEGSILWFHYVNGLGEQLIDKDKNRPITMSEFIYRLYQDGLFRDYYDQLFVFLNQVAEGKHTSNLQDAIQTLEEINNFLEKNRVTISMD